MQRVFEPTRRAPRNRAAAADPASLASSFSRRRHIDLQRVASCLCHA